MAPVHYWLGKKMRESEDKKRIVTHSLCETGELLTLCTVNIFYSDHQLLKISCIITEGRYIFKLNNIDTFVHRLHIYVCSYLQSCILVHVYILYIYIYIYVCVCVCVCV